jgi:hypothetical protein
MYADNRWNEATAGRVYPKPRYTIHLAGKLGTSVRALVAERVALDATLAREVEAEVAAEVRARLDTRAAFERNRARREERLVKPAAYKNINASNGSGPSGVLR